MRVGSFKVQPLMIMLVFVPVCVGLKLLRTDPVWVFGASALAIVPLAGLMGKATEHLAAHYGAGVGGLLNATFGNAAELIIGLVALKAGLIDVVKASITGSIIGNVLLVLGASVLCGGLKHEKQFFNRTAASLGVTLLALSTVGLIIPAIFHIIASNRAVAAERELSLEIAIVLFVCYLLSLVFSLRTHKHLYLGEGSDDPPDEDAGESSWSKRRALIVLMTATAAVAVMSELLVGAVEHTAHTLGMTDVFIGVILVAIVGNAAEHSTAVMMALKNQMDLAMNIAIGSSIQIALFVAPVLVFMGYVFGQSMNLLFTNFETLSVAISVWIVVLIASDGESNWMEGVQLLAVYLILALAFYYLPEDV